MTVCKNILIFFIYVCLLHSIIQIPIRYTYTIYLYDIRIRYSYTIFLYDIPPFTEPDKTHHHPDVHELARLSEIAQVDLRIIVMHWNALSILESTVLHRNFAEKEQETVILADNAAVLSAQLLSIDHKFFTCIQFTKLGDVDTWRSGVTAFLHPYLLNNGEALLPAMLAPIKNS